MHIFLSYASEDRPRAEEIALALRNDGHDVFFDRVQLAGGEHYHQVIREQIAATDLFVFLITAHAVQAGGYTLTELRIAQDRWPSPIGHVVPVLLEPTPMADIPAYLRSVTLFEPKGSAAAEIATHIERASMPRNRRRRAALAAVLLAAISGIGLFVYFSDSTPTTPPFVSTIAESDFVAAFVMSQNHIERTEYSLDPTSRLAADGAEVVALQRLAFGRLEDGRKAFSVRVGITNTTDQPIQLDLTPRFFAMSDDRGRHAELLYFCCEAQGDIIAPGQQRVIQLIYASAPGWEGKETTPGMIRFQISGLLPVVRATWAFRPLATAA
jgi:hypothetical protein